MADNVAITAGSGTSIATDDISGVQVQRVKVTHGADGVMSDANATTPLPVQDVPQSITSGKKQVATAATAVALASTAACRAVAVTALDTNLGIVVVGGSDVVAAAGTQASPTRKGIPLRPLDTITIPIKDPSLIFVDALNNNDGVSFVVLA